MITQDDLRQLAYRVRTQLARDGFAGASVFCGRCDGPLVLCRLRIVGT